MSEKVQMSYHIELECSTIIYAEATYTGAIEAKCIGQWWYLYMYLHSSLYSQSKCVVVQCTRSLHI